MRTADRRTVLIGLRIVAAAVLATLAADARAQLPRPNAIPRMPLRIVGQRPSTASDEDVSENVFLPPDRRTLQQLADARTLIAESRFGEAVRYLGAILESREDFFYRPDQTSTMYRSLRAEAQRLIGQMPREGREVYELQYGAQAKQMLNAALTAGDMAAVADVAREFFHTRAGYHATLLLGLHYFDRGRPLAGALMLQRCARRRRIPTN